MPTIRETVVTTISSEGQVHIAPFGLIEQAGDAAGETWIIAPFRPSVTLENLRRVPFLVANYVDDVRIFAGCLTGRRDFACVPLADGRPPRLAVALAHAEMEVVGVTEDAQRPRFACCVRTLRTHAPFRGFSRAQAAVIEAAILVSRLPMLPREKVEREIAYLASAIDKTAGAAELEAWSWLMDAIAAYGGAA